MRQILISIPSVKPKNLTCGTLVIDGKTLIRNNCFPSRLQQHSQHIILPDGFASSLFLTCPSNTNISSNFLRVIYNSLVLPKEDQLLLAQQLLLHPILVLQPSGGNKSPAFFSSRVPPATLILRSSFFQFPRCTCHIPSYNCPFRASSSDVSAPRSLRLSQSLT